MFSIYRITGDSMEPKYREGDFVLTVKLPRVFYRSNSDVVFRHPQVGPMVKRISFTDKKKSTFQAYGLNPASISPKEIGEISMREVKGKVLWHLKSP